MRIDILTLFPKIFEGFLSESILGRAIKNDIIKDESYVVVNDENQIIATSMFTTNSEPTYKIINSAIRW